MKLISDAQILPFYPSYQQISFNHPALYNVNGREFRLITRNTDLLPFLCPLPASYSGDFEIAVWNWKEGHIDFRIGPNQINHKVVTYNNQRYMLFTGGRVGCINLARCTPYYLQIGDWYSEVFYGEADVSGLMLLRLGNSKNLPGLPYKLFSQYVYLDGRLPTIEYESFQKSSIDERGNRSVSYSKITKVYNFDWRQVPSFFQGVLASISLLDSVIVSDLFNTIVINPKNSEFKLTEKQDWFSSVTLTLRELDEIESSYCSNEEFALDTAFPGVSNAAVCLPDSPIAGVSVACENPIAGVSVACDIESEMLDFQAFIVK